MEDIATYTEFYRRLEKEIQSSKKDNTPWMIEVGYRPQDKDCGLRRWAEISGKSISEGIAELNAINPPKYQKTEKEILQTSFEF